MIEQATKWRGEGIAVAAVVAYRAHWHGGGIALRATACGASVAAFGLAWFALVRACFDL